MNRGQCTMCGHLDGTPLPTRGQLCASCDYQPTAWQQVDRKLRAIVGCGVAGTLLLIVLMVVGLAIVITKWLSL